ncbi:MAG: anaerobic ribonucleoside-triphosphate reductase activating protein [Candidatus Thorarchaeota archaeon]
MVACPRSRRSDQDMRISSIIDLSLVDVPKIPVTVIFTAGCNFDCPYCQNAEIIPLDTGREMSPSEVAAETELRAGLTDGYCITGGEPTLQKDLPELLRLLKAKKEKHINLNTQGSVPSVLERSLPFLDSVWFDIKTTPEDYTRVVRTRSNPWSHVQESIDMIMDSGVLFWPRTTYVGGLMTPDHIEGIVSFLSDIGFRGEYVVQNYIESAGVRPDQVKGFTQVPREELDRVASSAPSGITLSLEWR